MPPPPPPRWSEGPKRYALPAGVLSLFGWVHLMMAHRCWATNSCRGACAVEQHPPLSLTHCLCHSQSLSFPLCHPHSVTFLHCHHTVPALFRVPPFYSVPCGMDLGQVIPERQRGNLARSLPLCRGRGQAHRGVYVSLEYRSKGVKRSTPLWGQEGGIWCDMGKGG